MVNKAAHRLVNPLAIGAFVKSHMPYIAHLTGFYSLTYAIATADEIHRAVRHVRLNGCTSTSRETFEPLCAPYMMRSHARFATSHYVHLPYDELDLRYLAKLQNTHFLHIDPDDKTRVRYFASVEHAVADRHTTTTLGRYLTQFYSDHYTADQIRDIAACFTAGNKRVDVRFLSTPQQIRNAYREGPRSCMSHPTQNYNAGGFHPVEVYGNSDLQLAVIYKDERVTARALVWPAEEIHGRIYGDYVTLAKQLNRLGYRHGSFDGAQIRHIDIGSGKIVLPYIDAYNENSVYESGGHAYVKVVNDDYLTILDPAPRDRSDIVNAGETSGYVHIPRCITCDMCESSVHEDDICEINEHQLCASCRDDHYTLVWGFRGEPQSCEYVENREIAAAPNAFRCRVDSGRLYHANLRSMLDLSYDVYGDTTAGNGNARVCWCAPPSLVVHQFGRTMLRADVSFVGGYINGIPGLLLPNVATSRRISEHQRLTLKIVRPGNFDNYTEIAREHIPLLQQYGAIDIDEERSTVTLLLTEAQNVAANG